MYSCHVMYTDVMSTAAIYIYLINAGMYTAAMYMSLLVYTAAMYNAIITFTIVHCCQTHLSCTIKLSSTKIFEVVASPYIGL